MYVTHRTEKDQKHMSEPGFMGFQDYHDLFHHDNPGIKRIMVQDNQFRIKKQD